MLELLYRYGFSVSELLLLWYYMVSFKDTKIKMNLKYLILILVMSGICTAATRVGNVQFDLILILLSCVILSMSIPSLIKYKIGMVLSFQSIGMLIQFEVWSLYGAFPNFTLFTNDSTKSFQRFVFWAFQAFTIILMSKVYGNQKICLKDLSEGILVALTFFSVFSVVVCTLVWQIANYIRIKLVYYACLLIVLLSIANFYILLYLIMRISKSIKEMLIKQRQIAILKERGKTIGEVNEKCEYLSKIKHNLKHTIISLWQAFESGDKNCVISKLRTMHVEVDSIDSGIYTKNIELNSIFRYGVGKSKQNNIGVSYQIEVPDDFNLEKDHLCELLGNIFDNAIEACQKIEKEKRFISISCKVINKMFFIKAENSKDPNETVNYKTTKRNRSEHGYGLKSINSISKFYEGTCVFKDNVDTFQVMCRLNIAKYLSDN